MANTTKPFNNLHFLTESQYSQETISDSDVYCVEMPSITPGEIVVNAFQGTMPTTLTAAQQAAAKAWFGLNHETWTFTLDDGTTVSKEVTLWT